MHILYTASVSTLRRTLEDPCWMGLTRFAINLGTLDRHPDSRRKYL